jgi:hypothetical protein
MVELMKNLSLKLIGKNYKKGVGEDRVVEERGHRCPKIAIKKALWEEECGKKSVGRRVWEEECGKKSVGRRVWEEECEGGRRGQTS